MSILPTRSASIAACGATLEERGRTPESVRRQYEATVRPAAEQCIRPSAANADLIVDGTGALDWKVERVLNEMRARGLLRSSALIRSPTACLCTLLRAPSLRFFRVAKVGWHNLKVRNHAARDRLPVFLMTPVQKFHGMFNPVCIYLRTVDMRDPMQTLNTIKRKAAVYLRQGISPRRLALTLALGFVVGCIPVVGLPTALCVVIALAFRLNQPAIQAANYLAMPFQAALIVPAGTAGRKADPDGGAEDSRSFGAAALAGATVRSLAATGAPVRRHGRAGSVCMVAARGAGGRAAHAHAHRAAAARARGGLRGNGRLDSISRFRTGFEVI